MVALIDHGVVSGPAAAMLIFCLVVLVWLAGPRNPEKLPKTAVLGATAFTFGALLPGLVGLVIQIAALSLGFILWFTMKPNSRRGGPVVLLVGLITVLWLLLMLHPNVPDWNTALLGFRKTVLALGGLVLGCAVAQSSIRAVELLVVRLISAALAISITGYFFVPALADLVPRAADKYTALYGGSERLQGVFSGPFHAAGAGLLLIGWALVRLREYPRSAPVVGALGVVSTYFTFVRSAYVAVALMVVVLVLISPSIKSRLRRFYLSVAGALAAYFALRQGGAFTTTAESLSGFSTDGRFLNRLPEWEHGLDLVGRSPIFGWGAGSAGDTLGSAFSAGEHVTPHNILLKFAVEGGLLGLGLIILLVIAVLQTTDWRSPQGQLSALSAVGLVGMGITGSAIDTLPISYFALLLVGLAVGYSRKSAGADSKGQKWSTRDGLKRAESGIYHQGCQSRKEVLR